jgi:hypothetical protein
MILIADETRQFIAAGLEGDPALASLTITGTDADTIAATITPGRRPSHNVPMGSMMRAVHGPLFDWEVLVELVVRMQRRRWQRFDAYALGLAPPDTEGWRAVHELIGVPQIGPGWHDLVLAAGAWIAEIGGEARTSDLSEKNGGLRWHCIVQGPDLVEQIIAAAEDLSDYVCDVCGAPGGHVGRGWIYTRCAEHDHE